MLSVKDKIEVNVTTVWMPATVRKIFPDRELGFFSAEIRNGNRLSLIQVMINDEDKWRYPIASVSP